MDPKLLTVLRRFRVKELTWETENSFTLRLVPEAGGNMFSFVPGQWVYLCLLNTDGTTWRRAAFSVASAPEESQEQFELGIKVYGAFSKRTSQLMPDDVVGIQGPFGVFTLREGVSPLIFFVGGIGITPFRSMIRSLWLRRAATKVILFYSNKTVEDIAYLEELKKIQKEWANFQPIFILTGQGVLPPGEWEMGRITREMVKKYVADFQEGAFLMCGPPGFMDVVKMILEAEGVDVKKRLRKELFG